MPSPVSSTLNWSAIEDAIRAWVMGAAGYSEAQVLFSDQAADAPSTNYVTVQVGDFVRRGGPAETDHNYDGARPAGQEIEIQARHPGEIVVSLQAFTDEVHGDASARSLLTKVQAALELETYRDPLNDAGLGVVDVGVVDSVPQFFGTRAEGRATLDVRFFVVQTATERVGYIATVQSVNLTGNDTMDI